MKRALIVTVISLILASKLRVGNHSKMQVARSGLAASDSRRTQVCHMSGLYQMQRRSAAWPCCDEASWRQAMGFVRAAHKGRPVKIRA